MQLSRELASGEHLAAGRANPFAEFWRPILITAALTAALLKLSPTCNQALAIVIAGAVVTLWFYDKPTATIAGIVAFIVKPVFVRIAYAIDTYQGGAAGFDLLGVTPALLLAGLIVIQLWSDFSAGRPLCPDRTRAFLWVFVGASFLSIFNPASSLVIGVAGFERNILPNMMILFLTASVFCSRESVTRLVRILLIVGLVSCAYAIGQYALLIYPWEQRWLDDVILSRSASGWYTVGLRGIELRVFSIFYGYMDFFFSNVLIFALVLACKEWFSPGWRLVRIIYFTLWAAILVLSLERMPVVMCFATVVTLYFIAGSPRRRKIVAFSALTLTVTSFALLQVAGPALQNTGAATLVRFAELANPFAAGSIQDRAETKWGPALTTIRSNPLGVGIGYGSQTKANEAAKATDLYVQPHNELIQKALETGIIGAIFYAILLVACLAAANQFRSSGHPMRRLGAGFVAATIAFWICGLVNLPFSGSPGILYWSVAGVITSVSASQRTSS